MPRAHSLRGGPTEKTKKLWNEVLELYKKERDNGGVLDADVTGPSMAKSFGISEKAYQMDNLILPAKTKTGIDVISTNMLLENEEDAILWRGSLISSLVQQFYKDVRWEEKDVLLIDMPPGTGDVSLTTFQSIPVDQLIIVTTPQDLVSMIVKKSINMAKEMNAYYTGKAKYQKGKGWSLDESIRRAIRKALR